MSMTRIKRAAFLAVFFILWAGVSYAQTPCKTLDMVKAEAVQHRFTTNIWTAVSVDLTQAYLALYNASPPETNFTAHRMVVAIANQVFNNGRNVMPEGTALLVLMDARDCVAMMAIVHPKHHGPIMDALSARPKKTGLRV